METKPEGRITADDAELFEQVKESRCPVCGEQPDYESVEVDSGTAYQRADCPSCELTWWEHYEMSDVSYADPADDKREVWRRVHEEGAALKAKIQTALTMLEMGKDDAAAETLALALKEAR